MKFAIRETVSPSDKDQVLESVRGCGGVVTMSRRDFDGGEVIELKCGSGKKTVKVRWIHWAPMEPPLLMVGSNDVDALSKVVATIAFGQPFFDGLADSMRGEN